MCAQGCTARKGAGGALTALAGLTGLRELHVHGLGGCEGAALEGLLAALPGLKALSLGAPTPAAAAPALSALRAITGLRSLHVRRRARAAAPARGGAGCLCGGGSGWRTLQQTMPASFGPGLKYDQTWSVAQTQTAACSAFTRLLQLARPGVSTNAQDHAHLAGRLFRSPPRACASLR
jgi:hypothetical protein